MLGVEIVNDGELLEFTVILIVFEEPIVVVTQVRLVVILQVTASPLASVEEENVSALIPTFEPLIFH